MSCKLIQDIHDKMNMSNFHCNKNVYPKTKTHRTKMMFKKAKNSICIDFDKTKLHAA